MISRCILLSVLFCACHKENDNILQAEVDDSDIMQTGEPIQFTSNIGVFSTGSLTSRYGIINDTIISNTRGGTLRVWAYKHPVSSPITDWRGLEPYIYDIDNPDAMRNSFYAGIKLKMEGNNAPYSYFEGDRQFSWPMSSTSALDFYAVYSTHPDFDKRNATGNLNGNYFLAATCTERPSILTCICGNSDFRVSQQCDLLVAEPVLNKVNQGTNEPIQFVFYHKYAQIQVRFMDIIKSDATLSDVKLVIGTTNLIYSTIESIDNATRKVWNSSVLKNADWPLYTPSDETVLRGDNADNYFCTLMVPQTLKNVKLKALYENEKGVHTVELDLTGTKIEAGKIYTYYLARNDDYILFTPPEVTPWEVVKKGDISF